MKIGIIGFGKMGMLHAGIVNALEGYETSAVSENSKSLLSSLNIIKPDINTYLDYTKMLDKERLGAVFITTPVHLHADMALECVKKDIPIFIEKPLSLTPDQVLPLVKELRERGTVNMVGYMMRYISTFKKAKEILESGILGKTITFNATMYVSQLFKKGKGWRYDKTKSGGGVLMGPGCHIIDLIYWYFGNAKGVNASAIDWYSDTTEDFIHVMFDMESGSRGWFDLSWSVRGYRMPLTTIHAHCEKGLLIVDDDTVKIMLDEETKDYPAGWTIIQKPEISDSVEFDIGGSQYTLEDADFLNSIKNGKNPESTVISAANVQSIIKSIYISAEDKGNYKEVDII